MREKWRRKIILNKIKLSSLCRGEVGEGRAGRGEAQEGETGRGREERPE